MGQHLSERHARHALMLLFAVNLVNYIDRQVLYAVFPLIKADLELSDTALGVLGSAFMLCYMFSAPVLGWLGDRVSRVALAAGGLGVWSLATAAAGLTNHYFTLLAARTAVGVGEASFGTVSPGLVSDYFARERRGRVLSRFYLAIPVGSALGYVLGGVVGQHFGWQAAFFMVAAPGLLLVLPLRRLREPPRGGDAGRLTAAPDPSADEGYRSLWHNRSFVVSTLATAAMTFALGGLAQWVPTFLVRVHGLDVGRANILFGGVTVVAGIIGTLAGGWLGDRFQRASASGYLLVSGWGFVLGAPLMAYALLTASPAGCLTTIFIAELFLFLNTGPLNTVVVNVTRPSIRAMAFAVNIFFIHALGDAASPTLLGHLSDVWAERLGSDLLGLRYALLVTPVTTLLAGLLTFFCMRFIAADMARAER